MNKITIQNIDKFAGFAIDNITPGNFGRVCTSAFLTSDNKEFYKYIEQISNIFFSYNKIGIFVDINYISHFLIILHEDKTADVYLNDFSISLKILSKQHINEGMPIFNNDIADIAELKFNDIAIAESDCVIFCFKVDWKFGLYFNLSHNVDNTYKLDILDMQKRLAMLYRILRFEYIYKTLENDSLYSKLVNDGWFPFIQLLGFEYKQLTEAYEDNVYFENRIKSFLNIFTNERISIITQNWWSNEIFNRKKNIITAGVDAYLTKTDNGYINCIKNLYTEIDGILEIVYYSHEKSSPRYNKLPNHLKNCVETKIGSDTLLFPKQFSDYLTKVFFRDFRIDDENIDISRHSVSHGVAKAETYDEARALQCILILDQIFYYIR